MRAFLAALAIVAIVAMTATAYAQNLQGMANGGNRGNETAGPKEPPKKRADEKEYKSSLGRLPDKKFDPWGKVR
jgi:hypothetical protein